MFFLQQGEIESERDEATTPNKGHGRIEKRRLVTTTLLNEHLDWPGVKQVCQTTRTTTRKGVTTTEVAYGIASVGRGQANAAKLLEWQRGHWGIENKEYWVRDEQLRPPTNEGGKRLKTVVKLLKTAVGSAAIPLPKFWLASEIWQ